MMKKKRGYRVCPSGIRHNGHQLPSDAVVLQVCHHAGLMGRLHTLGMHASTASSAYWSSLAVARSAHLHLATCCCPYCCCLLPAAHQPDHCWRVKQPLTEASAVADGTQSCQALPAATWQACSILQLTYLSGLWLAYHSKSCFQQHDTLLHFVTPYSWCSSMRAASCTVQYLLRFLWFLTLLVI
jgi:hypothetical protein